MRTRRLRTLSLLVLLVFLTELVAPTLLLAQEAERWDQKLLTRLADRAQAVVQKVIAKVNTTPGNDVRLKTFLCDKDHRVFMDLEGTVLLSFPALTETWKQKIEEGAGAHVATNGSLALDFNLTKVEKLSEKQYRVAFRADVVLILKEVAREIFEKAAALIGAATVGLALGKLVTFFEGMDAESLGMAVKEALLKIWLLVSGKTAVDAYQVLDQTGHISVRQVLAEGITARSVIYHIGVFILQAGVKAGATLAKLSLGAALGASLAVKVGALVGGALAVAAIGILGAIVVDKLTRDLPIYMHLRSLRRHHESRLAVEPGSDEDQRLLDEMGAVEDRLLEYVDRELPLDRYVFFDKMVAQLGELKKDGALAPYDGLIEKLKARLQDAILQKTNWNAARKYWQFMAAIDRLPQGEAPANP